MARGHQQRSGRSIRSRSRRHSRNRRTPIASTLHYETMPDDRDYGVFMTTASPQSHREFTTSVALVALSLGGLLIGYQPVRGDPDTMYRPIKSELARCLRAGEL